MIYLSYVYFTSNVCFAIVNCESTILLAFENFISMIYIHMIDILYAYYCGVCFCQWIVNRRDVAGVWEDSNAYYTLHIIYTFHITYICIHCMSHVLVRRELTMMRCCSHLSSARCICYVHSYTALLVYRNCSTALYIL